eukprot:CAMPEP_0201125998 /NCGR_PEP_ID=MMETSP0850-20130426/24201_1 /ASSEMBLY_ACC=CAM_ASM_000622 /TAXON_ID=183588 /ORGANISM="Pseudo-nitzschia fraudulenta, Strain WWA7" /LENGTH=132 /DNA_ID=CAMNT_0047394243 /DNA_START=246 /DNA_END=641 /DNA_ORIENTATION=+
MSQRTAVPPTGSGILRNERAPPQQQQQRGRQQPRHGHRGFHWKRWVPESPVRLVGRILRLRRQGTGARGRSGETPPGGTPNRVERREAAEGMPTNRHETGGVFACDEMVKRKKKPPNEDSGSHRTAPHQNSW